MEELPTLREQSIANGKTAIDAAIGAGRRLRRTARDANPLLQIQHQLIAIEGRGGRRDSENIRKSGERRWKMIMSVMRRASKQIRGKRVWGKVWRRRMRECGKQTSTDKQSTR